MAQELLAYFSADFSDDDVAALRGVVERLAKDHKWTLRSPQFVDEVDDSSCIQPGDKPVRTVGVVLLVSAPVETPATP